MAGVKDFMMKVLLADSKANILYGLNVLLEEQPDIDIVGESAEIENIVSKVIRTCPDLIILSWDFPKQQVEDIMRKIRLSCPNIFVIALSSKSYLKETAIQSGANDFIWKGDPPIRLLSSIQNLIKITA